MADRREYYKQYREKNKEYIKQYNAERYKLNKNEILAQQASSEKKKTWCKEKIKCDVCGAVVCKPAIARHKKTNKCINHENKI